MVAMALFVVAALFPVRTFAQEVPGRVNPDSLHIYLLTCSPHQEVYSLYGHTAIRIVNEQTGMDVAINYGVFNFNAPNFVLRFVFGLTDYEMGIYPTDLFEREYRHYGSGVTQQEINLTADEKLRFFAAVEENYREENRVYRYNYFYDNCTTRARDIIEHSISGRVEYREEVPEGTTFRELIHQMNTDHPWARLGNDLLLGIGADRQLTFREMQFLPHTMMFAAQKAEIVDGKGVRRPFVKAETEMIDEGVQVVEKEFPLAPMQCAVVLVALVIAASVVEYRMRRYLWYVDGLLLLLHGIVGLVLTAMIFSQHPTVSANTQILLFCPLQLLFGWQAVSRYRRGRVHWLWLLQIIMISLLLVLHSLGVQRVDMAVRLVALSLLLRCGLKMRNFRQLK